MYSRSTLGSIIALACLLCGPPPPANAQTTLDFENLSNPSGGEYHDQGKSVTQHGFTVTASSDSLYSIAPSALGYNYNGSVALYSNGGGMTTTLTQNDGNAFALNSIDIADLYKQSSTFSGVTVNFTGIKQGGETVTQSFTHGGNNNVETVKFGNGWTNLVSVSFDQSASPYNEFDNIVLDGGVTTPTTPEPGSIALLVGFGVAGAGFLRKRRTR